MSVVSFVVVGLGRIGKRHIDVIRRISNAKLVAVCDVLPQEEFGLENLEVPFFSNIDDLLNSNINFDVVDICTPNGFHAEQAIKSLAKKYHVLLEKPMALTKLDAERIVNASEQSSCGVFCVMQNRYSPPSVWLKQIITEGRLGKIYMVQLNCYWNRDERYYAPRNWHGTVDRDGGTLFTQFSHFIDIMYWLFGDITNIQGNFHDFSHQSLTDFEDSGVVSFDFVNGGMGSLNYSTSVWDKNLESSIIIIGENGTVKVAGQYMNEVEYCHIKDYEMPQLAPSNPPNDYGTYKGSAQNHHYVIQNVVEKLQESGTITTNVLEGMKVIDIIERIYQVRDSQWKK